MAEEQQWQQEHHLCANNCGFFGSPATHNLCSKCYRDRSLKEEAQRSDQNILLPPTATTTTSSSSIDSGILTAVTSPALALAPVVEATVTLPAAPEVEVTGPTRCASCRKRVELTGFKCRCGATYCGTHRYPEQHSCGFNFKAAGRAEIARANPLVKADKLQKI